VVKVQGSGFGILKFAICNLQLTICNLLFVALRNRDARAGDEPRRYGPGVFYAMEPGAGRGAWISPAAAAVRCRCHSPPGVAPRPSDF
jgi:hypothetical protein